MYTDPNGEFWHIIIGAAIGGTINLAYKAISGQIKNPGDALMAFGIGAASGAIGAATGGAAFLAAGGAAAGGGGFLAGAFSGLIGYIAAAPYENLANHFAFGDPIMSPMEHAMGMAISGLTGGIVNGASAFNNNKNVWTGESVANGRTKFSLNNTPVKPKYSPSELRNEVKLLDAPKASVPKTPQLDTRNSVEYTINYENAGPTKYAPDGIKIDLSIPRPEIKGYNSNLTLKTDLYHNFPKDFDNIIINNGGWNGTIAQPRDPSMGLLKGSWFELPGTINGKPGMYEIGINQGGIIYHRHFRPIK